MRSRFPSSASRTEVGPRAWDAACILLIFGIVLFYALTIRPGHDWGGDFSMYIGHAKNIVESIPYAETGYIHDPASIAAPEAYPPVFPMLLVPIYAAFGLDIHAMKLLIIVFFGLALWLMYLIFRPYLESGYALAIIGLVGLNPYFWSFKDNVLADIPALLFILATLLVVERWERDSDSDRSPVATGVLIGLLAYLAYGTRSVGAIVLPALIAYQILINRRITRVGVVATATTVVLAILQHIIVPIESGYAKLFSLDPTILVNNAVNYGKALSLLWENGYSKLLRGSMFAVCGLLALWGIWQKWRRSPSIVDVFTVLYAVPILTFSVGGLTQPRYVIPLMPLYLFYAAYGVSTLRTSSRSSPIPALFLAVAAACYFSRYTTLHYGPISTGIAQPDSIALFEFVKRNTKRDDVLMFAKPRVLALFGERRVVSYHGRASHDALWRYIVAQRVNFVVVGTGALRPELDYLRPGYLGEFVEQFPDRFQLLSVHGPLEVYAVVPPG